MPNPRLDKAINDCKEYRRFTKQNDIPKGLAKKGFLLTKDMITRLMSQNGGNIDGIRIYLGMEMQGNQPTALNSFAVACVKNGENYNDYKMPKGHQQAGVDATTASMGDATNTTLTATSLSEEPVVEDPRPCPSECGEANDLNTGG